MSLELKEIFLGPPSPSAKRGFNVQVDVHKDGDTVAYGNSKFVITRSLTPGGPAKVYIGHKNDVTVARFNHSGYYVSSGDDGGYLRTWSYTHVDNLLKKESKQLGKISDLCWDGESKRIALCGDGTKKGACISWDSHASLDPNSQITGLGSNCPSVAFKPNRPFRMVTATETGSFCFVKGPPMALLKTGSIHKNVVQCIRYAKDGSKFASVSNDKKIHVFDGKSGERLSSMKFGKKSRHNGFVYGVAWSADGTQLFTASSDKTCKLWDVESQKLVGTFNSAGGAKPQVRNQQLGCVYSKHGPLSVALNGDLTIYDVDKADTPIKTVLVGHQDPLSALAYDAETDTLATGCRGGLVCLWKDGVARRFSGDADPSNSNIVHKAGIIGLCVSKTSVFSIGTDGVRNTLDVSTGKVASSEGIGSAALCIAYARGKPGTFVYGHKGDKITHVVGGKVAGTVELSSQPLCVAISDDGSLIIVSTEDKCVQFFSGTDLALKNSIKFNNQITAAAFSPDNATFVVAKRGSYSISLYKTEDYSMILSSYWGHKGCVDSVAFSTDGKYVASGSKDGYISFWMPADKAFKVTKQAHFQGVTRVVFTKSGLASIGSDNCLKIWKLGPPEPAAASAGY